MQTENFIFSIIYMCIYMYIKQQLMKKCYEFERDQGEVYGSVWKEEREGKMI